MTINTKFDIGDVVFYLKDNKVTDDTIEVIDFSKYKDGSGGLKYKVSKYTNGNWTYFKEEQLFKSKQELIESL